MNIDHRRHRINRSPKILGLNFKLAAMLFVISFPILMFYTNQVKREQIISEYCGDFGFYGKQLTLYNDKSFVFHYHGCSQSRGRLKGNWEIENNQLQLDYEFTGNLLLSVYQIAGDSLKVMGSEDFEFILCSEYTDQWSRTMSKR